MCDEKINVDQLKSKDIPLESKQLLKVKMAV
jgi:hypothetical protein